MGLGGVGGVCEMCMRLARDSVGGEGLRGLGLGFTNAMGTGEVLDVCVLWLRWCRWGVGRRFGSGGVRWCYVCVSCESGFSV